MKKVFIFLLVVSIAATAFSGIIQNIRTPDNNPGTAVILDYIAPAIAYADSDTVANRDVPPPPPPIH